MVNKRIKRTTKQCEKCSRNISLSNYIRHLTSCKGIKTRKIRNIDFDPNIGFKNGTRIIWNKGLTKKDLRVAKNGIEIGKTLKGRVLSKERCLQISASMRVNHKSGGYRERAGRSKKALILDSFGKRTCLQSSYEVLCSQLLNKLSAKWFRPKCLYYDNHSKRYFPDFYLTDYDIYLDPKNDYLINIDKEKIEKVIEENKIKLYVLSKDQLTEQYLLSVLQVTDYQI